MGRLGRSRQAHSRPSGVPKRLLIFGIKQTGVEAGVVMTGGAETAGSDAFVRIGDRSCRGRCGCLGHDRGDAKSR